MPQIILPNLDENALNMLRAQSSLNGHSLVEELKLILEASARATEELTIAEFIKKTDPFRHELVGRTHTDSTVLLREGR
jgi:plasmid stability protein